MLRYLFYLAFGYIIIKILRVFIDPVLEKKMPATQPDASPKADKTSRLGEYVEYEEVK